MDIQNSLPGNLKSCKVGFIGAGNMAEALCKGFIKQGLVDPANVIVSAPSNRNFKKFSNLGVKTTNDNKMVVKNSSIVFLAVKPHIISTAIGSLMEDRDSEDESSWYAKDSSLFVSVAAGVKIKDIEQTLAIVTSSPKVIRVMPNTPCLVSEGCCAYSLGKSCTSSEEKVLKALLSSVGICERVNEPILDGICGVAGSGPAYIYAAIEAMADGAVKMGVPRNIAMSFAAQTVRGAATMVLESGKHPGQLKDEVCSPGGTTITAMHELEKHGFRNALMSAVEASALKSKELS